MHIVDFNPELKIQIHFKYRIPEPYLMLTDGLRRYF